VRVAHDGPAAIESASAQRPEVVLLDIGLPGMDGFEVAARFRQEEYGRKAMLIAISGYGEDQVSERMREAGFDHHLVKPVDIDALLTLLDRADAVA
jgi:CheY-like chemotaxis protein